jgi:DNA-directed RNA polymerase subunit RPC12/RpoP
MSLKLADVVRRHGPAYVDAHGPSLLPSHVRALRSIAACRTAALGGHLALCAACGREHVLYHSCRHRACPQCGFDAASRWLDKQRDLLLAVPYYHVVFTLPAELRRLVRTHQKVLLSVLFRAAFDALSRLCADPRYLGGKIGALAVLHTWTRTLEWHPHIHMLVPGGGLMSDETWRRVPRRPKPFLVPVKALAKLFRGRFLAMARKALPELRFPYLPRKKRWVVFAKPTVSGTDQVLVYLGRYVHRTALSDTAIISTDEETVSFRYRDSRTHEQKTMNLPATEFLRRFLQHVPPKGFHRVRAFGLLHPEHRLILNRLQLLLGTGDPNGRATSSRPAASTPESRPGLTCPHCRRPALQLIRRLSARDCLERALRASVSTQSTARAPPSEPPRRDPP